MIHYESISDVEVEHSHAGDEANPEPPTSGKIGMWPVVLCLYAMPFMVSLIARILGSS